MFQLVLPQQNNLLPFHLHRLSNTSMHKNFRSSKNLKQLPLQAISSELKDDSSFLRLKIKSLQQQVQLLRKSNLNIFIPLSEKQPSNVKQKQNKDEMIRKLRVQLLKEQQENQNMERKLKRVEKDKQVMREKYQAELDKRKIQINSMRQELEEVKKENQQLEQLYQKQKQSKQEMQRSLIQLKVQLRFTKQDLQMFKARYQQSSKSYNQLKSLILNVQFNSNIYKSATTNITAIQSSQLKSMRQCILELQRQIQQLLYKLSAPAKKQQQPSLLIMNTKNVAEQIVRLKKNIDRQLGFKGDENVVKGFMDSYLKTNQKFKQLIDGCKVGDNKN